MSEEKRQKTNDSIEKGADDFDNFKLFLKKKKIQNKVLKKMIDKVESGFGNSSDK